MHIEKKDSVYLSEWNGRNKQVSISNGKEEKSYNKWLFDKGLGGGKEYSEVATVQICFELLRESGICEH